tara:strand:+ start:283 stop:465 length:183 start_codon:yes stop_codon:yes gene_type:complete
MKTGDLVLATRKESSKTTRNRYLGIYIKEEYGDKFVECGGTRVGRFSPDFWDVKVVSENR